MNELQQFEKSFHDKKIIWMQGNEKAMPEQVLYEMLQKINVPLSSVGLMLTSQLTNVFSRGTAHLLATRYDVLVISDFEFQSKKEIDHLLSVLISYQQFKRSIPVRIILMSSPYFPHASRFEEALQPFIISLSQAGQDPSDLNERVHSLIEYASHLTSQRITRITEEVAFWLEVQSLRGDDELLIILIRAFSRMNGDSILRMKYLSESMPQHTQPLLNAAAN